VLLQGVSNLLVIGWSGAEEHFLKKAVPVLSNSAELTLTVVSDTERSANETQARLGNADLSTTRVRTYGGGFTDFIVGGNVKVFFRRDGGIC
jgi:hypothetical protein